MGHISRFVKGNADRSTKTTTGAGSQPRTRPARVDMVRGAGWADEEWKAYVEKHGGSAARAERDELT